MESGTFLPSSMAYGYKIVNKKIEIEPDAALVVCRIFQWYLDGINKTRIAAMLDKEGIPTNQNKIWRESAVHYILTNERYIGDSLWQKSYTTDTFPVTRCKNKGEREKYYAAGTHPPIIAKETFDQVQKLIQRRKETFGKKRREQPYPLSRKLICENCDLGQTPRHGSRQGQHPI